MANAYREDLGPLVPAPAQYLTVQPKFCAFCGLTLVSAAVAIQTGFDPVTGEPNEPWASAGLTCPEGHGAWAYRNNAWRRIDSWLTR